MIYVTGSSGLIGSRFVELCKCPITKVSYRENVEDVFETHEKSCLVHFAWSTTTRTSYNESEKYLKYDVYNSKVLFDLYLNKNPNGKIIFLSSAGGLHTGENVKVDESSPPLSKTFYGDCKLEVEKILNSLDCETISLRVSNVWGGLNNSEERVNGLVDKLIKNLNTDNIIELYCNLNSKIDLIHVDDLIELILKIIEKGNINQHQMYLVGSQSLTIIDIIDRISSSGSLTIKFNKKENKTYLHVDNSKVRFTFDWNPSRKLI